MLSAPLADIVSFHSKIAPDPICRVQYAGSIGNNKNNRMGKEAEKDTSNKIMTTAAATTTTTTTTTKEEVQKHV